MVWVCVCAEARVRSATQRQQQLRQKQQMVLRRRRPWIWYKNNSVRCDYRRPSNNNNAGKKPSKFSLFRRLSMCGKRKRRDVPDDEDERRRRVWMCSIHTCAWHLFAYIHRHSVCLLLRLLLLLLFYLTFVALAPVIWFHRIDEIWRMPPDRLR